MNTKLRDRDTLQNSDRDTGFLVASSNNTKTSKPRKAYIASTLPEAMDKANPFVVVPEKIELVSYTLDDGSTDDVLIASGPTGSSNNLAIREGSTRHNFTDGYDMLEFVIQWYDNTFTNTQTFLQTDRFRIPIQAWLASTATSPIGIAYRDGGDISFQPIGGSSSGPTAQRVWRNSDTSFGISNFQDVANIVQNSDYAVVSAINGYRPALKLQSEV